VSVAYVDLKAAFDSVDRTALWKALQGIGVPDRLLSSSSLRIFTPIPLPRYAKEGTHLNASPQDKV
jgi:hypothetical protein